MVKALSVYTAILDVCEISALCLQHHTLLESTFINRAFSSVNACSVCVRARTITAVCFVLSAASLVHTHIVLVTVYRFTAVFISAVKSVRTHTPKHLPLLHNQQTSTFPKSENKNINNSDLMKPKLDLFVGHLY